MGTGVPLNCIYNILDPSCFTVDNVINETNKFGINELMMRTYKIMTRE